MILALINVVTVLILLGVSVYLFIVYLDVNSTTKDAREKNNMSTTSGIPTYKINSMSNVTVPIVSGVSQSSVPKAPSGPPAPGTQTTTTPSTSKTT